jgi:hypothetical protein
MGSINYPLKVIADSQSKIANIPLSSKPNSKSLQVLSKGLGRNPFMKKSEGKNLAELSL